MYGFRHGERHERKLQINVLFHNGAKFDLRLIIEHLASKCNRSNISCIAHSMETFIVLLIIYLIKTQIFNQSKLNSHHYFNILKMMQ